mmetsp:Transcript_19220/g.30697  ORF Transcript_19220/g.30697 Transcript_19220/m.30697 type:complete len:310 (+) Transcript_19220:281-1210(+)
MAMGQRRARSFAPWLFFFERFAHDALLKEFPEPKEPIMTPKSLPVLQKIPASEQQASHELRWLAILIGDLHQPLHWLPEYSYGKDIKVTFREAEHTLLSFWEEYLPRHLHFLQKAEIKPDLTDAEYSKRSQDWASKVPTELFREWAQDTAKQVCEGVYGPMIVNHADGSRKPDNPFQLSEELFEKWVVLAEELMSLGGERLAFVLNDILEHKRHKEAHKDGRGLHSVKTAVGTQTKKSAAGSSKTSATTKSGLIHRKLKISERRRSRKNGSVNLGIAVVVVPSLLALLTWHQRLGGGSLLRLTGKHLKM